MESEILIRDATVGDHASIDALITAAFDQPEEANLVAQLRRDGDVAYELVARDASLTIVGHILLSRLDAPIPSLALAPLCVAPPHQRTGIGSRLIEAACERARQDGWDAIFVVGDPGYYPRFGFDPARAAPFEAPWPGPHFMVLALRDPLSPATGRITYPEAFSAFE